MFCCLINAIYYIWIISLQERDPIERVRKLILSHDIATDKELKVCWWVPDCTTCIVLYPFHKKLMIIGNPGTLIIEGILNRGRWSLQLVLDITWFSHLADDTMIWWICPYTMFCCNSFYDQPQKVNPCTLSLSPFSMTDTRCPPGSADTNCGGLFLLQCFLV